MQLRLLIGAWQISAAVLPPPFDVRRSTFDGDGHHSGASEITGQTPDDLIGADREGLAVSRSMSQPSSKTAIRPAEIPTARERKVSGRDITSAAAGGMARIFAANVSMSSN